jgi:outer membrane beta-barrel protein
MFPCMKAIFVFSTVLLACMPVFGAASDSDSKEEVIDTQVIRPRFFSKRNSLEISSEGVVITNQSFIYTYMLSAQADYHFNEYVGAELEYAYGWSVDKKEKTTLVDDFDIRTQIDRVQSMILGGITLTPMYGKYQLSESSLLYFDTFISVGGGVTGIDYQYDQCIQSKGYVAPSPRVVQYPTAFVGIGQRFFVGNRGSLRYDIRSHFYQGDSADGACDVQAPSSLSISQTVTIQLGYSYYF